MLFFRLQYFHPGRAANFLIRILADKISSHCAKHSFFGRLDIVE